MGSCGKPTRFLNRLSRFKSGRGHQTIAWGMVCVLRVRRAGCKCATAKGVFVHRDERVCARANQVGAARDAEARRYAFRWNSFRAWHVDSFARVLRITSAMPSHVQASKPALVIRAVALLSAGMVVLLSFASVSPELHAWLHKPYQAKAHPCSHHGPEAHDDNESSHSAHSCAVTLFSHGVLHHAVAMAVQPCEGILRAVDLRAFERLALAQPRFLHLPPQAPPAV